MNTAFEDALVLNYSELIDGRKNDPKDRQVLATAVSCGADAIVSENRWHFKEEHLRSYGLGVIGADEFLIYQYHFDRDPVIATLEQEAEKIKLDLDSLLRKLQRNMPGFVALVERGDRSSRRSSDITLMAADRQKPRRHHRRRVPQLRYLRRHLRWLAGRRAGRRGERSAYQSQ
jgi:hypothetical protein